MSNCLWVPHDAVSPGMISNLLCAGAVCSGTRPGQKGATDGYNTRGTNPQGVGEPVGRVGAGACPPAGKTGVEQRDGPGCQTSPPGGLCQRRGRDARGEC